MIKKVEDSETNESPPFSNSKRVYVFGKNQEIAVPMREISLSPTNLPEGKKELNDPVRVYDTSGPWGDSEFHGDHAKGLPALRSKWLSLIHISEPTRRM